MKLMSKDIRPNTSLTTFFLLTSIKLRISQTNRKYLTLELYDRTGKVRGFIWDHDLIEKLTVTENSFVKISGKTRMFKDYIVIDIEQIRTAEEGEIEVSDFIGIVSQGVGYWKKSIFEMVSIIHDENCLMLLHTFLDDEEFVQCFITSFGGIYLHHNYIGGLLEHTVNTMRQAVLIANKYPRLLDKDLLLLGAFLHDIGKIREIRWVGTGEYTTEGKLLGHIPIGISMIEERLSYIGSFPKDLAVLLKHMVLSHHGSPKYGSPVRPSTPEAVVLHHIEGMDARINHLYSHYGHPDSNRIWSPFDRFLKTSIYQGGYLKKNVTQIKKEEIA